MTMVDAIQLEVAVKDLYRHVAQDPGGPFHFPLGRALATRLGYPERWLHEVPAGAVESFAGVGYFFDLADLRPGERVLDLGSGSGMDAFVAARRVGRSGRVVGIDITAEQLQKARRLAAEAGVMNVEFLEGRIEDLPLANDSCDAVISNGVVNLSPDKRRVYNEAARVLRPGGRIAVADIVTDRHLKESIVAEAELWAACIGGAAQQETYRRDIEAAGLGITDFRVNEYEFLSHRARDASARYGVKSVSLLAVKPDR
jgi:SAM-dependent methyltransferase